jgi:hypothetical protein
LSSDEWISDKSKKNMINYYASELQKIHETNSAKHLSKLELQRFKSEGWVVWDHWINGPDRYKLSEEVKSVLGIG